MRPGPGWASSGPEQQHRAAQTTDQRPVRFILDDSTGAAARRKRRAPDPFHFPAEIEDEPGHDLDVR